MPCVLSGEFSKNARERSLENSLPKNFSENSLAFSGKFLENLENSRRIFSENSPKKNFGGKPFWRNWKEKAMTCSLFLREEKKFFVRREIMKRRIRSKFSTFDQNVSPCRATQWLRPFKMSGSVFSFGHHPNERSGQKGQFDFLVSLNW